MSALDVTDGNLVGSATLTVTHATVTHFNVVAIDDPLTAGVQDLNFDIEALDAFGNKDTDYVGPVHFSSTDPITSGLPSDHPITNGDDSNPITLFTAGTQTVSVSDVGNPSITGSQTILVVAAPATHLGFLASYPSPTVAGVAHSLTVQALDDFSNVDTSYTGDVTVTATGGTTVVSPSAATALTLGQGVFDVTFDSVGTGRSIDATGTGGVTAANQAGIEVTPATAVSIAISPSTATITAGGSQAYTAEATDSLSNTFDVTSSTTFDVDGTACGSATCSPTSAGDHTVTGTYLALTDTATLTVNPAAATHLVFSVPYPATTEAGALHDVTVHALDAFNNLDTNYVGLVTVTATGGTTHVVPAVATALVAGAGSYSVTFDIVGSGRSIGATASGLTAASQAGIAVTPATATHLVFSLPYPGTTMAGVSNGVVVHALDGLGNLDTNFTGAVTFAAAGGVTHVSPSVATALVAGSGAFSATFDTVGTGRSITASASGVTAASQAGIAVTVAPITHIVLSPANQTTTAGVGVTYSAEGFDAFNNDAGPATTNTTFTIDGLACPAHVCSAVTFGAHTVTGLNVPLGNLSATTQLTITNTAPVAGDDSLALLEDAAATTVNVRANDTDVNLDTLTITVKTNGTKGTVAIVAGTSVTYTPNLNAVGSDSFTYTISDGHGGTDIGTVNVTISGVNDAPTFALGTSPSILEQSGVVVQTVPAFATGMSAGPADEAGQVLSFTISNSQPALFAVQPSVNVTTGTLTYTPAVNRNGVATVTLVLHDSGDVLNGGVNATSHTFTITITGPNHVPFAINDSFTVVTGSSSAALTVLTNDNAANQDVGETLLIRNVTQGVMGGKVTITGGGTGLTYKPKAGFVGTDFFRYRVHDAALTSAYATVLVRVIKDTFRPVATAPVQTLSGQAIGSSTVVVRLSWTGTDVGTGIAKYYVYQSVNGRAYTKIKTVTFHATTVSVRVGATYQFKVRAVDRKGNVGASAYGPTFRVLRYQESSATYSSPWVLATSTVYSGGNDRYTKTPGNDASFTATGRTFAWVSARGTARSTADVYVDGVLSRHVSMTASKTTYRYLAYSITFATPGSHTLRIVYTGPTTKRIDVDAFIVLQ